MQLILAFVLAASSPAAAEGSQAPSATPIYQSGSDRTFVFYHETVPLLRSSTKVSFASGDGSLTLPQCNAPRGSSVGASLSAAHPVTVSIVIHSTAKAVEFAAEPFLLDLPRPLGWKVAAAVVVDAETDEVLARASIARIADHRVSLIFPGLTLPVNRLLRIQVVDATPRAP